MKQSRFYSLFTLLIFFLLVACGAPTGVVQHKIPKEEYRQKSPPDSVVADIQEESYKAVKDREEKEQLVQKDRPFTAREFRAAWVASVANINWPSRRDLSTQEQQQEAIELLDFLEEHHFNAVILQVRPQADALYDSDIEPWSYYLTGEQGKAPNPYYDPLEFWIEAAHDRGLELHAWLNPFRAHHTTGGEPGPKSIVNTHPELVKKLKNGMYWMDPGMKETRELSRAVVKDLIDRYDLDGIHFDDYFYPYDSYNGGADFPDDKSWAAYKNSGGKLSRGDWRRENVNIFIQSVYKTIKHDKPNVKLGISPFGIWRPGYPQSIAGSDPYEELYADSRLWLEKGWVDYMAPQLYWKVNQYAQSFPVLLGWWGRQNLKGRHLWPGMSVDRGGGETNIDEVINQIMITRGMQSESPGAIHWSIAPLLKYPELAEALLDGPYQKRALVPETPWLQPEIPEAPIVNVEKEGEQLKISWKPGDDKEVFRWVVYLKTDTGWNYMILDRHVDFLELGGLDNSQMVSRIMEIAVTAVSYTENESAFKSVKVGATGIQSKI